MNSMGPSVAASPAPQWQGRATMPSLYMGAGIQTQVLMFTLHWLWSPRCKERVSLCRKADDTPYEPWNLGDKDRDSGPRRSVRTASSGRHPTVFRNCSSHQEKPATWPARDRLPHGGVSVHLNPWLFHSTAGQLASPSGRFSKQLALNLQGVSHTPHSSLGECGYQID